MLEGGAEQGVEAVDNKALENKRTGDELDGGVRKEPRDAD
jgi:hypothetical protein